MNREEMIKRAKLLHTVSKTCCKILAAAVIVLAIFALLVLFVKDEGFLSNVSTLQFGKVELELAESALPAPENLRSRLAIGLGASAMICAFLCYGAYVLTGMFAAIREGRPFEGVVSRGLRTMAILTFAGGLLYQVADGVASALLIKSYGLLELFKEGMVKSVHVNVHLELGFILLALALFLMSYIFRYGEELQRESDETL